jgi:hypothetical protein
MYLPRQLRNGFSPVRLQSVEDEPVNAIEVAGLRT